MALIVEQEILSFVNTNIEEEYPEYNPSTTYTYEETPTSASVVRVGGFFYRSVAEDNTENDPIETEGVWWTKYSTSNTYAMLDQKSLTKTTLNFTESDADYLSTDTQTDIAQDSLVWDTVNYKMYKSLVATNDLPNVDFSDTSLWENKSDIIVEFVRGNIDTIGLGYVEAGNITIEHYDQVGNIIPEATQVFDYTSTLNDEVYDLWDYIYANYDFQTNRADLVKINPVGYTVKITIERQPSTLVASCGFLVGGEAIEIGKTENGVGQTFTSYSVVSKDAFGTTSITKRNVEDSITFNSFIDKPLWQKNKRLIKRLYDEIVMFILDEDGANDGFEYLITFGKINNADMVATIADKSAISWSVTESI